MISKLFICNLQLMNKVEIQTIRTRNRINRIEHVMQEKRMGEKRKKRIKERRENKIREKRKNKNEYAKMKWMAGDRVVEKAGATDMPEGRLLMKKKNRIDEYKR